MFSVRSPLVVGSFSILAKAPRHHSASLNKICTCFQQRHRTEHFVETRKGPQTWISVFQMHEDSTTAEGSCDETRRCLGNLLRLLVSSVAAVFPGQLVKPRPAASRSSAPWRELKKNFTLLRNFLNTASQHNGKTITCPAATSAQPRLS
mmetsp:Transcript_24387/g.64157  ORF Transcript_24387/g.64157 Transcript_24387/m.64157 type:complete len:149 (-) Transcript_24387:246-692(-)